MAEHRTRWKIGAWAGDHGFYLLADDRDYWLGHQCDPDSVHRHRISQASYETLLHHETPVLLWPFGDEYTAEQFERDYAARGKTTVEELRTYGRMVAPCTCGEDMCTGWQSVSRELWESDEWLRKRNGGEGWTWPR